MHRCILWKTTQLEKLLNCSLFVSLRMFIQVNIFWPIQFKCGPHFLMLLSPFRHWSQHAHEKMCEQKISKTMFTDSSKNTKKLMWISLEWVSPRHISFCIINATFNDVINLCYAQFSNLLGLFSQWVLYFLVQTQNLNEDMLSEFFGLLFSLL